MLATAPSVHVSGNLYSVNLVGATLLCQDPAAKNSDSSVSVILSSLSSALQLRFRCCYPSLKYGSNLGYWIKSLEIIDKAS